MATGTLCGGRAADSPSIFLEFLMLMRGTMGLILALLVAASTDAATESPIRSVDVRQDSDAYVANLVMFAPVPLKTAWDVLVDFNHMSGWVPNLRESKVVATDGNALTVEQRGTAKFGIFSIPYTSVRKMQLDALKTVRATQIEGNMRQLESLMTLAGADGGTQLTYRLEMIPGGLAATVLSKEFLEHELREQFTAIIEEMVRRNR